MSAEELYQARLVELSRRPHALPAGGARVTVDNAFCGDTITVARSETGPGWEGEGCALMKASAALLVELAAGRSPEELRALRARLDAVLAGGPGEADADFEVFGPVASHASRKRCVTLPWDALAKLL